MPSPFVTAFSTIAGGQQQTAAQAAAYNQQVQARALEDQLRRAQLMMQLEDAMSQRKAMETLKPDDQRALLLGESYADIQKRQALSGRVQTWKSMIGQALIDPDRPLDQKKKLLQLYGTIDENSDPGDIEKQLKDFGGLGDKPGRPFELVDKDTGLPVYVTDPAHPPANAIPVSEFNALRNPSRNPSMKFGETPIGALTGQVMLKPNGEAFSDPRMTVDQGIAQGGVLLTNKAADQLHLSVSAEKNLDTLDQAGKQVLPAQVPTGLGETFADVTINPARRALLARVDPRYAAYEHSKAGIISYVRDLANAGRINQAEMNIIVDRLNNAQTYPALQSAVDTAKAIIRQDRSSLVKGGTLSTTGQGAPVYDATGKLLGYTADGKTMTPVGP